MDPFSLMRREIERLFEAPTRGGAVQEQSGATLFAPRINVSEDDREVKISAEMPGMKPEDITVSVNDDVLTIRGEHEEERENKRKDYHVVERSIGVFQRSLRLPFPVDPSQIQARVENGVLTVTIPKTDAKRRTHQIAVDSGSRSGASDVGGGNGGSGDAGKSSDGGTATEGGAQSEQSPRH
jgi:HSP20 family protein